MRAAHGGWDAHGQTAVNAEAAGYCRAAWVPLMVMPAHQGRQLLWLRRSRRLAPPPPAAARHSQKMWTQRAITHWPLASMYSMQPLHLSVITLRSTSCMVPATGGGDHGPRGRGGGRRAVVRCCCRRTQRRWRSAASGGAPIAPGPPPRSRRGWSGLRHTPWLRPCALAGRRSQGGRDSWSGLSGKGPGASWCDLGGVERAPDNVYERSAGRCARMGGSQRAGEVRPRRPR